MLTEHRVIHRDLTARKIDDQKDQSNKMWSSHTKIVKSSIGIPPYLTLAALTYNEAIINYFL
jgi:hypothetical protein